MGEFTTKIVRAINQYQTTAISEREFLTTMRKVLLDIEHGEWQAKQDAMTATERDKYWEGYGDDEFLVGRGRRY